MPWASEWRQANSACVTGSVAQEICRNCWPISQVSPAGVNATAVAAAATYCGDVWRQGQDCYCSVSHGNRLYREDFSSCCWLLRRHSQIYAEMSQNSTRTWKFRRYVLIAVCVWLGPANSTDLPHVTWEARFNQHLHVCSSGFQAD